MHLVKMAAFLILVGCKQAEFEASSRQTNGQKGAQTVKYAGTEGKGDPSPSLTPDPSSSSNSPGASPSSSEIPTPSLAPTPTPCIESETLRFNATTSPILANVEDLWTAKQRDGGGGANGAAPVQLFSSQRLQANDKLYFLGASGNSIFRTYAGVSQWTACDAFVTQAGYKHAWFIYFKDAAGNNLDTTNGRFGQVHDFDNGVLVPPGAISAWIGYRDDPSGYDDNEGNRSPGFGSTHGCIFNFKVTTANLCTQ